MSTLCLPNQPSQPYSKKPGIEPIPGYVLIEPLGRGGFGEVWKCVAPGGLHKAIKFVAGGDDELIGNNDAQLRQEYNAFQQVKAIRHPYLLCLERVELVGNELVMVMGLADRHLGDRFSECQKAGLPGIPRDELLGYLKEAAEALDVISTQYSLQHLDVKPANLFLTAGHVQVGDYGLVSKLEGGAGRSRGLTPKYAAPEVLRGQVHASSDQYSLALVYQELLTGTFPFSGRTPQQIMLQHTSAVPDLNGLPEQDRKAVAIALAKQPEGRFASCRDFIDALVNAKNLPAANPPLSQLALRLKGTANARSPSDLLLTPPPRSPERPVTPALIAPAPARIPSEPSDPTHRNSLATTSPSNAGVPRREAENSPTVALNGPPDSVVGIQLPEILSVVPVGWLRGQEAPDPDLPPDDMVRAILATATARESSPSAPTGVIEQPDGTWTCRFLTTIDPRVAKVKLDLLWERGGVTMDTRDENQVVFRQTAPVLPPSGVFSTFGKNAPPPSGLEVIVRLPEPGTPIGEVHSHGRLFGSPPPDFVPQARKVIVELLEGVQRHLNNFQERRKHPRIAADFPIILYPVQSDGRVEMPLSGRCQDVSAGGLALQVTAQPPTKYAYVAFEGVRGTSGLAVLFQIIRAARQDDGFVVNGRYKLGLDRKSVV